MNEEEQLKALQQELDLLKNQLRQQQDKIRDLQVRIIQLAGRTGQPDPVVKQNTEYIHHSLENFLGLRLIQFIGIIVLVIGLSIGVKYAIDKQLISELMRIILAYTAGGILFILSQWARKKYVLFSALLFSGAMASMYFTTYAAFVYYNFFSFLVAFLIMVALTVFTVYEAIRYNRQEIALLGLVGAYGIPFLISKNADRADLFFFYIAMINSAVVYLSVYKKWKTVGRVANLITWVLFIAWASARMSLRWETTGIFFMIFFFILFGLGSLAQKLFNKQAITLNDSYQLIANNIALCISTLFVFDKTMHPAGLPSITLALSIVMAVESMLLYLAWKEERFLSHSLSSLALALFAVYIAVQWSGLTVTLLWLLVAVIVFVVGIMIRSVHSRLMSIVLLGVTLFKLVAFDSMTFTTVQKVISYLLLGVLLLVISFYYQRFKQQLFHDD